MLARRKGFTLIELLVVIAIIGILAAMLFPVFARARESARKVQCLTNVKNIAMAIQMYLTDYDALWPDEHRQEVIDYFNARRSNCFNHRAYFANPYLRVPVILDEYIKNRDVWNCASARLVQGASWIIGMPDWWEYLVATDGVWPSDDAGGPCRIGWPSGWGGTVTDSLAQRMLATGRWSGGGAAQGAFVQAIATTMHPEMKLSEARDVSAFIICGDGGAQCDNLGPGNMAYPDLCMLECAGCSGAGPDWENCAWSRDCGAVLEYKTDPMVLKSFTRHMGGVNVGFLDGHARWISSQAALAEMPRYACGCWGGTLVYRGFEGIGPWGPTSAAGSPADGVPEGATPSVENCGFPPLY